MKNTKTASQWEAEVRAREAARLNPPVETRPTWEQAKSKTKGRMKTISGKEYILIKVRKFGRNAQIAMLRQEHHNDKLYVWRGNHKFPRECWIQASLETPEEFRTRIKEQLAAE